jgi:hypothetical protein
MPVSNSKLAQMFAQRISKAFKSPRFHEGIRKEVLQNHETIAHEIERELKKFLKSKAPKSVAAAQVDWEGNDRTRADQLRACEVFGTRTHPDAAVLAPFKCAFEFDNELKRNSSGFKGRLMKASVHVLSGYYQACVLLYILPPGGNPPAYLDDGSPYTQKLRRRLEKAGLYVSQVSKGR